MMKKFDKTLLVIGIIYLTFGIVFAIIGIGSAALVSADRDNWVETYGVISDFSNHKNSGGHISTTTFVTYEFEGHTYESDCHYYSSRQKIGDEILIYVDPEYPQNITTKEGPRVLSIIFAAVGCFFAVLGAVFIVIVVRRKRSRMWLNDHGERLTGTVTGIDNNTHLYVNGRRTFKLIVQADVGGERREFLSKPLVENELSQNQVGRHVLVYVDPLKPKRYFVDTDSIW